MPQLESRHSFKLGLPRMHNEPGEKRDFLPDFVQRAVERGFHPVLEHGYGSGMGFTEDDYLRLAPSIIFSDHATTFQQDYVLVLRCPNDAELRQMHRGARLISMLHYPTRPQRVRLLRSLGIEGLSLDSVKDDTGRRVVENLRAVAWNGTEVAFKVLRNTYPSPGFESPERPPIRVALMGAGAVGTQVVQAAVRYGDLAYWKEQLSRQTPGVMLTVVDVDITRNEEAMREILSRTDMLIDATQRPDTSVPVIPNAWLTEMPLNAVLLDLSVDPYDCSVQPPEVKGIEGIPQGNLDQYIFAPDDPAYRLLPPCVDTTNRRYAVSCYSWPGIYPKECMTIYGHQITPILRMIAESGGIQNIHPQGTFFHRAISRAMLSRWSART